MGVVGFETPPTFCRHVRGRVPRQFKLLDRPDTIVRQPPCIRGAVCNARLPEALDWCTAAGGYGNGWSTDYGAFAKYADANGLDATEACCACGRGGATPSRNVTWVLLNESSGCLPIFTPLYGKCSDFPFLPLNAVFFFAGQNSLETAQCMQVDLFCC